MKIGIDWESVNLYWVNPGPNGLAGLTDTRILYGSAPNVLSGTDDLHRTTGGATADQAELTKSNLTGGQGVRYFFVVECENASGWSSGSAEVSAVLPGGSPAPQGVSTPTGVTYQWDLYSYNPGTVNVSFSYVNGTYHMDGVVLLWYKNNTSTSPLGIFQATFNDDLKGNGTTHFWLPPAFFTFSPYVPYYFRLQAFNSSAGTNYTLSQEANLSVSSEVSFGGGNGSGGTTINNYYFANNAAPAGLAAIVMAIILGMVIVGWAAKKRRR